MKREGIVAVIVILVVASLGIGYLSGASTSRTETVTLTSVSTSATTSTSTAIAPIVPGTAATAISSIGSSGLDLVVGINATTLKEGQSLNVEVSLFNTLQTINNMSISDSWPFQGIPLAVWPECDLLRLGSSSIGFNMSWAAEAVVLKGDYAIANISSVADINVPGPQCTETMLVDRVMFEPNSAQANLTVHYGNPSAPNSTVGPYHVAGTFTTNGYWQPGTGGFLGYPGQQFIDNPATPFTPGVYTVGIEDMWGQAVILHFMIKETS